MRLLFSLICMIAGLTALALDIPKGTFYFDNSKTQYSNVKFVYGSDSRNETHIASMSRDEGQRWKITFENAVTDMYRYTFAETSIADGMIEKTFSTVKEEISKTYNERRTATTDKAILAGGIFVPESGDNWAQGNWTALDGTTPLTSGTLPVLYINTDNGADITSTETYLSATYRLDNMGAAWCDTIAFPDAPIPMEIRGRGNYTWKDFDKKPYRIKLAEKKKLLGMNKSRHFVLLAHPDDRLAFLRNTVGFELSRRLGIMFTPAQRPVELVINGDYKGLYFATENIRVAKDRVNVVEQLDNETDPTLITGGWIIEIDNYDEDGQVRITEGNGETIHFTPQSPEILSYQQRSYLTNQVSLMNNAIYSADKNSTYWEELIDTDSLARFYIVQEIMDNAESFHGSCYMHKHQGSAEKWIFGPVWDFGNSYRRSWQEFVYQNPPFGQTWIGEIAKFPRFQQKVIEVWRNFKIKGDRYAGLEPFIDQFCEQIDAAAQYNYRRWSNYGNDNISNGKSEFLSYLGNRIDWLVGQWGEGTTGIADIEQSSIEIFSFAPGQITVTADSDIENITIHDATGRLIQSAAPGASEWISGSIEAGIYIVTARTSSATRTTKIRLQ